MSQYYSPGVYIREIVPPPVPGLQTGVPVFIGYTRYSPNKMDDQSSYVLTSWQDFLQKYGEPITTGFLGYAVQGFFENGGKICYVYPLKGDIEIALRRCLEFLESWEECDLVCAPDVMLNPGNVTGLQRALLDHCEKQGNRFAVLDSLHASDERTVLRQRQALRSNNGALYYPWVVVSSDTELCGKVVPPCGHIAGVYASTDRQIGVHKAPANVQLKGIVGIESDINVEIQDRLNPHGINCLRIFPGRGIRIWGARTLSATPTWRYINVRRLLMSVGCWCEKNLSDIVFEINHPRLWARLERALTAYLTELFMRGALQGKSAREAFYVKCDADTNTVDMINTGTIVTEIGLAPSVPSEFVVMHIVHSNNGVHLLDRIWNT